jgi:hypothetical protein
VLNKHLPQSQLDNVIRWIKTTDSLRLEFLDSAVAKHMRRLSLSWWEELAVNGIPNGSDHFDNGSLIDWMANISYGDDLAEKQLRSIYATIQKQLNG